ncbi:MAG: hypothetical protein AABZ47_09495 [Planctomycetota bacterium]
MKPWMIFVLCTVLCWGAYVPTLHHGQKALGEKNTAMRAFLFVGAAYFVVAGAVLIYVLVTRAEPWSFTSNGATLSSVAGVLGALGAIGIVFALKNGGKPIYVAPLVFGGAPIINTFVSMLWDRPAKAPGAMFYVGILLAGAGTALVLRFKPT